MPPQTYIGIDIGGTHVKAVACDAAGKVLGREKIETGDADDAWTAALVPLVQRLEQHRGAAADGVGVCTPGIARPDGSGISWMIGRMESVVDFDFTRYLGRERPVPVLNDAHAALLGEAWVGAATGVSDAILLTLGTGVGGAVLAGGRLLKGHTGRAGHLGHVTVNADGPPDICNTPGSIESVIGNYSLPDRTGGRYTSTERLVEAAQDGDAYAAEVWRNSVRKLAATIASLVNAFDPERVIVGGGMAAAGAALFGPLAEELARFEWRPAGVGVDVVPATLGEWAGAIGSALNALKQGTA